MKGKTVVSCMRCVHRHRAYPNGKCTHPSVIKFWGVTKRGLPPSITKARNDMRSPCGPDGKLFRGSDDA